MLVRLTATLKGAEEHLTLVSRKDAQPSTRFARGMLMINAEVTVIRTMYDKVLTRCEDCERGTHKLARQFLTHHKELVDRIKRIEKRNHKIDKTRLVLAEAFKNGNESKA